MMAEPKDIYLIPGYGADKRIFYNLNLTPNNVHIIEWIKPLSGETIESYATRMAEPIDKSKPFILIGFSMGGIISVEIAKQFPPEKIFLISSIKTKYEMPWHLRFVRKFQLQRLSPLLIKRLRFLAGMFVDNSGKGADAKLVMDMLNSSDEQFLLWARNVIVNWNNTTIPPNLFHIHGTNDRVFMFKSVKNVIPIEGGTHLMIITKGREISKIIREKLDI